MPVDKIVGPGNIYVFTAEKRSVFGQVGIDGAILKFWWSPMARPILVDRDGPFFPGRARRGCPVDPASPDADFLDAVEASLNRLLDSLERADGAALIGKPRRIDQVDLEHACEGVQPHCRPEHLELSVTDRKHLAADPARWLDFMGRYTPEALG
jgi:histidinol dehydrogenase